MRRKMRQSPCEEHCEVVGGWGVARFNKGLACGFSSEATIPTKQLQ